MNQYTVMVLAIGVLASLFSSTTSNAVPMIYCQPNSMIDAPPKVRQLCFALLERVDSPQEEGEAMDTQLVGRGTKRQDVDHVFLRFGRRLGF